MGPFGPILGPLGPIGALIGPTGSQIGPKWAEYEPMGPHRAQNDEFLARSGFARSRRFFFFKQKTAYEMLRSLVGSEMCIRDRWGPMSPYSIHFGPMRLQAGPIKAPMGPKGPKMGPYEPIWAHRALYKICLLYTSDAADE